MKVKRQLMADRWIISSYNFTTHDTLAIAEREAGRLREELPYKYFRIYRVKTTLPAGNTKAVLKAADDICAYIGYNLNEIKDPYLIAMAAKLQYEVALRTKHMVDEEMSEAWDDKVHA